MLDLKTTIARLTRDRGKWEQLMRDGARARGMRPPDRDVENTHLTEVRGFGSNPGNLRLFRYVPAGLADHAALVVVLHGCSQSAAAYDVGAGWSTLADRYGFALLLPEQQRANNPNGCFNWFQPGDAARGRGETQSIKQMIDKTVREGGIDPRRVFITGLSAGGAMTSVMLACYPEVFAGGAIIAGLPFGAAKNVQQAFESMFQCPARPAHEWGDMVRNAAQHAGPWPRVSVWHGGADQTVIPSNAREILKQWTDVHGLSLTPTHEAMVDGFPRQVWVAAAGAEMIESYTIPDMAHGTPLATGDADDACGVVGPFLLEVGISSSYHIAKFFGLTAAGPRRRAAAPQRRDRATVGLATPPAAASKVLEGEVLEGQALEAQALEGRTPEDRVLEGEVLDKDVEMKPRHAPPRGIDIGAVINKALRAAGLMK